MKRAALLGLVAVGSLGLATCADTYYGQDYGYYGSDYNHTGHYDHGRGYYDSRGYWHTDRSGFYDSNGYWQSRRDYDADGD